MKVSGRLICGVLLVLAGPALALEDNWVSLSAQGGQALFNDKCGMCHGTGGMGTGILGRRLEGKQALLENREDLQPKYVTTVVRNGLNNMFPMSRAEVSERQLAQIADYLSGKQRIGDSSSANREGDNQHE